VILPPGSFKKAYSSLHVQGRPAIKTAGGISVTPAVGHPLDSEVQVLQDFTHHELAIVAFAVENILVIDVEFFVDPLVISEFGNFVCVKPSPQQSRLAGIFVTRFLRDGCFVIVVQPYIDGPEKIPALVTKNFGGCGYSVFSSSFALEEIRPGMSRCSVVRKSILVNMATALAIEALVVPHQERNVVLNARDMVDAIIVHLEVILSIPERIVGNFVEGLPVQELIVTTYRQQHPG
jgi:hypothetical protein